MGHFVLQNISIVVGHDRVSKYALKLCDIVIPHGMRVENNRSWKAMFPANSKEFT